MYVNDNKPCDFEGDEYFEIGNLYFIFLIENCSEFYVNYIKLTNVINVTFVFFLIEIIRTIK